MSSDSSKNESKHVEPVNPEPLEFKSFYWHVVLIPNFLTAYEASTLMTQGEALFTSSNKVQRRRTNLTFGEKAGMTYKVEFGYGASKRSTIRRTLAYETVPMLPAIRLRVEEVLTHADSKVSLPMCAALRYPSGKYGIKRHRDREVPSGSIIAGLSVGEQRTLVLSSPRGDVTARLDLTPGSLYVFYPPTNERAFHAIEEEPERSDSRISFTFRTNWTPEDKA